jgi:hypothetical protein
MAGFSYAVHTEVCTYLLDDAGICTGVLSPNVSATSRLSGCVGAQFVACFDPRVEGGLVGELREGASALLVATAKDTGRAQLLRTGPILRVQTTELRDSVESMAGLVMEEIELELDEEPSVQVRLPLDPKARRAVADNRKKEDRSVIISDDTTYPALTQKSANKPAPPRSAGRSRPSASEIAGLPPPRKPSFANAGPDDTMKFNPTMRKNKK